ncbi:MAG: hypothetical protein N2423_03025 [Novosphingobium sp.]|nr:hypothetical protein [Novosphingobium sp.]
MKHAFTTTTAALALAAGLAGAWLVAASPALAKDCLLDRDNDGVVDAGTDNDGAANSNDVDFRLACGVSAQATGAQSTSIGAESDATGDGDRL